MFDIYHIQSVIIGGLNFYDLALLIVVSGMGVLTAYLKHPRWKSFLMLLPIPFTLATLAVGRNLGPAPVWGILLLGIFYRTIELLYKKCRWNIVVSIIISAILYCMLGFLLLPLLPDSDIFFWSSLSVLLIIAVLMRIFMNPPAESGEKTELPVHIKAGCISFVILLLICIKSALQGFITMFPMVGVIGAYEARNCLKTVSYQMPLFVITIAPMYVVFYCFQSKMGVAGALLAGWPAYFIMLWLNRKSWFPAR